MAMARVKPTLEAIRVRATFACRLLANLVNTSTDRTHAAFLLPRLSRSFVSFASLLKRKKDAHYKCNTRDWKWSGRQLIFPKFTSNSSRIIYLYLSLSSRLHAFERMRNEWNFFNRSLVGKLTEVIDEMGNIFVKITRVHENVIDTRTSVY